MPQGEEPTTHMWEQVSRLGRIFYVPLDQHFQPIGDLALEDMSDDIQHLIANSVTVAPLLEAPAVWDRQLESLVVQSVHAILAEGDSTTYEIYERLFSRLQQSGLLDAGGTVDLIQILARHFHCYEFQGEHDVVLRMWTVSNVAGPTISRALPPALAEDWGAFIERNLN